MLESLNASAKKVGLHVALGKGGTSYSIRNIVTGQLVSKDLSEEEVSIVIRDAAK